MIQTNLSDHLLFDLPNDYFWHDDSSNLSEGILTGPTDTLKEIFEFFRGI